MTTGDGTASRGRVARRLKRRRKSRLRLMGISVVGVLLIAGSGVAASLYLLQPSRHFRAAHLPVLANPQSSGAPGDAASPLQPQLSVPKPKDGSFNVLFLGIDSLAPSDPGHTDTIIVVHVDLVTHQYNAISIPRDTRMYLPGYGMTKITHAQYLGTVNGGLAQGIKDIVQAVSNFTGLQVNYYAETSFGGLESLVDAVGGIDLYFPSEVNLQTFNVPPLPAGEHHLDGLQVHEVVGERKSLPNGDFGRQKVQEEVLLALGHKILSPENLFHISSLLESLQEYLVATNMTTADAVTIALNMQKCSSAEVHYYQVPGHGATMPDPVVGTNLDYWIPNLPAVQQIIKDHFE